MTAPTASVGELMELVSRILDATIEGEIWVRGEIRSAKRAASGHLYFDLVDPDDEAGWKRPVLPVVLFAGASHGVNHVLGKARQPDLLSEGNQVRIRGRVIFYPPRSTVQLRMGAVDPSYTAGRLAAERNAVLLALDHDGLLDRNGALQIPTLPRRIGLVTSTGSAAHHDVMAVFDDAGIGFEILLAHTKVQGDGAPRAVAAAIAAARSHGAEVILVVRGGGSRSDLDTFDTELVARSIAEAGVPVFTGVGHDVDTSVADRVAAVHTTTPTACARALTDRVSAELDRIEHDWDRVMLSGAQVIADLDRRLAVDTQRLAQVGEHTIQRREARLTSLAGRASRLARALTSKNQARMDELTQRATSAAQHRLEISEQDVHQLQRSLTRSGERRLAATSAQLDVLAAQVAALDPVQTMARGWSITRTSDGRVITDPGQVEPGAIIETQLAVGSISSHVDSTRSS